MSSNYMQKHLKQNNATNQEEKQSVSVDATLLEERLDEFKNKVTRGLMLLFLNKPEDAIYHPLADNLADIIQRHVNRYVKTDPKSFDAEQFGNYLGQLIGAAIPHALRPESLSAVDANRTKFLWASVNAVFKEVNKDVSSSLTNIFAACNPPLLENQVDTMLEGYYSAIKEVQINFETKQSRDLGALESFTPPEKKKMPGLY